MGLITILSEDNFTSQFYVKRVAIPEKAVLLTPLKTKWPFLAILWPNMALVTILSEDNFTSQFYVKRGSDSTKSSLIDPTEDKMAIFGHIMAKFGQILV